MEIFRKCCILLVLVLCQVASEALGSCSNESSYAKSDKFNHSSVLSRRKRFLVFPEGSSLQLVFCVQTAALIPIGYVGQLFLYGNTIALAWVLPKDPSFLTMFKDKDVFSAQRRTDDVRHIYYVGENGEFLKKVPYQRRPIVNPAFAKRSIDSRATFNQAKRPKIKINRKSMHEKQLRREFLKMEHMDESSIRFHRSSRLGLFKKLEGLFEALGSDDGRGCLLRQLCEAAQPYATQRAFLTEVFTVLFTLPKSGTYSEDSDKEYDEAHTINKDCASLYPCNN